jgi:hypothetical protein
MTRSPPLKKSGRLYVGSVIIEPLGHQKFGLKLIKHGIVKPFQMSTVIMLHPPNAGINL